MTKTFRRLQTQERLESGTACPPPPPPPLDTHAHSNNTSLSSGEKQHLWFDCETCRMFPACLRVPLSHRALLRPQQHPLYDVYPVSYDGFIGRHGWLILVGMKCLQFTSGEKFVFLLCE